MEKCFINKNFVYFIRDGGNAVIKNVITDKYYNYPEGTPFKEDIGELEKYYNENKDNIPKSDLQELFSMESEKNIPVVSPHKFIFVSASANSHPKDTLIYSSFCRIGNFKTLYNGIFSDVKFDQVLGNSKGLSQLYNEYITEENRDKIIVFVHDDVLIEDLFILDKLTEAHKRYDVVGIAGCKNPVIKSPAYWHLMAERKNLRGFCSHFITGSEEMNMSSFGNSLTDVDLIDGVFMSVNVSSLLDANVKFNEKFDFHFYDLAFSMNVKNGGLKLGVWPIFIRHASPGGGNARWAELEPEFIKEYA